ncbi:MAG: SsrA-binding protein [Microgenomates group bacterium GW2011_GWC1_41_8]|uniref:SsrA-binding protein n=3 Tax=Candidatus Roizmaniibacteriota TaxID=1752723 RepID=A0A0G0ZIM2_9BACT|nr:MAG: SsrA-binding protein [Candidatus Levybacteria bacterium GW2011_GWA2_40_16]KKR72455.1 MAG: SsrA-binding protein [Candidatus Roizmanbacteria bacterium GW2011_GWB1_40_7]KKR94790.1 MAG: SsrA-binding protein [Candidatus Roizmanbacteria bacterium GW2011_GWA1_41_13]KKS21891.1 MAG: SsrA-binding protein [Candidatus Roizmanbacteria bacterium GW2011_GWC2_41_7]KKS23402.1 MAG: SsrA-binding protein [Microgenomates group bacterium GW2011_GWC1_41_8]OGK47697.1 MAG: SsrA-binding protein [Candidatus Roiz
MKNVNRSARHDYFIQDTVEAGIQLLGPEVKSIKQGRVKLDASHVRILAGEAFLINASIPLYEYSNMPDYSPTRTRKLLLHKNQLVSLETKLKQGKLTLIPLSCYTTGRGIIKLEIGLGRAKQTRDKRKELRKRALDRDVERALREKEG